MELSGDKISLAFMLARSLNLDRAGALAKIKFCAARAVLVKVRLLKKPTTFICAAQLASRTLKFKGIK